MRSGGRRLLSGCRALISLVLRKNIIERKVLRWKEEGDEVKGQKLDGKYTFSGIQ